MANTCIICGNSAGSREHVFPAALGGRRTNSNIYCTTHDNGYSDLVLELSEQLDLFNSMLGVYPDHGKKPKSVIGIDEKTGNKIKTSVAKASLIGPRIISQKEEGAGVKLEMSFEDQKSIDNWIIEKKSAGYTVNVIEKKPERTYYLDSIHYTKYFGGPYGLAAIAYVAQTFLAQSFPEIARSEALSSFRNYTQTIATEARKKKICSNNGSSFIQWDFAKKTDEFGSLPNAYEFGHRVTIGTDKKTGYIYGEISLFSAIRFKILFGVDKYLDFTKVICTDINPLARHPPNDIETKEIPSNNINKFEFLSDKYSFPENIRNGNAESAFNILIQRISNYSLMQAGIGMAEQLNKKVGANAKTRQDILKILLNAHSQRVLNTARSYVKLLKDSEFGKNRQVIFPFIDDLVSSDASSENGLSEAASIFLTDVLASLLQTMSKEDELGLLNAERLSDFVGGELCMTTIATKVYEMVSKKFLA